MTESSSLVSGPDPVEATERAFDWADEEASDGPDAVLCLTQHRDRADALERQWASDRDPLRFRATTLDSYVGQLYERATASLSESTLNKPERLRLVEAAIDQYEPGDGPFAAIDRPSNDLVDQVQGFFSLLEYAGYATPAEIERALHGAGLAGDDALDPDLFGSFRDVEPAGTDGPLATQARTFSELYAEYERLREELHPDWKTVSAEQYLRLLDDDLLVDAIPASVDAVVLEGLTRLAPVERAAIARIARTVPTVAAVPLLHDSAAGSGLDRGVERALVVYQSIGFELDYEVPDAVEERRLDAVRSLHVPSRDPPTYDPDEVGLEWLEPATEREEVRAVARRVRGLLARDDVDPSDVGLVVTDRTTYRGILAETLSAYDVPFTFTNDVGIEQTLVGDAVEAVLNLADDGPPGDPLCSLCSNCLVSLAEFGVDPTAVRRAAAESPGRSTDELVDALERRGATSTADGVRQFVQRVDPAGASLAEFVSDVEDVLAALGIEAAVEAFGAPDTATGSHRPAYERSAWESVESVLSSVETVAPRLGDDEPAVRVRQALRAELVGGPAQQDGYVRVFPLAEAETASFEHLFALGLTSGYFPSERDTMAVFGDVNEADEEFGRVHTGRRAQYITGTLLTGSETVVLSTPQHTVDGAEHVPAPLVTELRQYVRPPAGEPDDGGDEPPIAVSEDVQRRYAGWACSEQFDSPDRAADVLDGCDALPEECRAFAARGLATAWRRSRPDLTAHDGQIAAVLDEAYPDERREPFSPSALEEYARCPFRFLSKQVLGFEENYGDERDVGRGDRGTFVHEALADFYRELREAEDGPVDLGEFDRSELEAALLTAALARLDELGGIETPFARRTVTRLLAGLGAPSDNPYYGAALAGSAQGAAPRGLLARFLDAELEDQTGTQARPTYFEAAVGIEYDGVELLRAGPVAIETPDGSVSVRGIADRVDVAPGDPRGIYVRDYKTGSTPARADVTGGTKLQLPLYGHVLETVLEDRTGVAHETIGGAYYGLNSPTDVDPTAAQVTSRAAVEPESGPPLVEATSQPWRLPFDSHEEASQFVREVTPARVGRIASAVENGAFHPTLLSQDRAGCADCRFRDACDVRPHHRRDAIEGIDETRHYVSERARGEELDLDAYAAGGED